jgi:hypothetical protein
MFAPACDPIGSDIAATVGSTRITIQQVRALVAAIDAANTEQGTRALPEPATNEFRINGEAARFALAGWIRLSVAEQETQRRKLSPDDTDRQRADQELASLTKLPKSDRKRLADGLAALSALTRAIAADAPASTVEQVAERIFAEIPEDDRDLRCFQGIQGPAAGADAVEELLDGGTPLDQFAAFIDRQYNPISQTGAELCLRPSEVARIPDPVGPAFAAARPGERQRVAFSSQGQDGVVFFELARTDRLTPQSPQILQQAQQQVEQERQGSMNELLAEVFKRYPIRVDARFGRGFDPAESVVMPPTSPLSLTPRPAANG